MTEPVYRRIADQLRDRIDAGEFTADAPLPTDKALAEEHDVNKHTIRRAYDELVNEGLVVSRGARGRFLRLRQRDVFRLDEEFGPPTSAFMDRFLARLAAEGRDASQTIDVALTKPPAEVAELLETSDDVVVLRRRNRLIDGEPYNINDSYYPRDVVQGSEIMLPVDIARGANQVLAELDHRQVKGLDRIRSRMPTPDEVRRLELGPGTPVTVLLRTGRDASGRPVRCVMNVLPSDKYEIVWEWEWPEETQA